MSLPNVNFWSQLLATVGVEVCGLAALGFVAQCFFRSAVWKRAVWQMIVICLLLLPASEWTGFGRGTAGFLFGHKQVVEKAPAAAYLVLKSGVAEGPITANFVQPPELERAVWWPGWAWLAGAVLVLGRMAAAQVLLLALRLRREKIVNQSLRARVAFVAKSVGLRRKVRLLWMPETISPMAFGIFRPSIGLPPGFEAKLRETEQEAVLAHELAHLAALDPMWFLLTDFATAWLWWHPLAWWVRRSLHGAAELAADEATAMVPDGPSALADCLVSLGKEMTASRGWSWVGINGGFRSNLGKRVERLMRMSGEGRRPLAGWAGAAAKLAATILVVPTMVLLFGSFQTAHAQKEESWRGQLRESWNSSPGAVLVLAALDDTQSKKDDIATPLNKKEDIDPSLRQRVDISTRVQNGKLLYEMHKYNEAEAILVQVIKDDPTNRSAPYYLDLIKELRYMDSARRRPEGLRRPSTPTALDSNIVYTTKGREFILSKLNNIILNEFFVDLPLKEALLKVRSESQRLDPEGIGINFLINEKVEGSTTLSNAPTGAPLKRDLGTDVTIKISPPLRHVRLGDVLDAFTEVADLPIRYKVEDYGVVFSSKLAETNPDLVLYSRTFRVDVSTFVQALQNAAGVTLNRDATNRTVALHQLASNYFGSLGVDLSAPKAVFFNDRVGELLVRATQTDLQIIQQAIELLNKTPPQVTIETRFVELSQTESQALGLNSYLGSTPLSNGVVDLTGGSAPPNHSSSTLAEPSGIFPGPVPVVIRPTSNTPGPVVAAAATLNGVMSDREFRLLLNGIEHSTGADILAAPKVTTESGRQAHVGNEDGKNGVSLEVIVEVGPDGFAIRTDAVASIKRDGQIWRFNASHKIWDGQTFVFSGSMTNQAPGNRKEMFVFVTPTIIDPAGNRVHTVDDLSKRTGIPDQ